MRKRQWVELLILLSATAATPASAMHDFSSVTDRAPFSSEVSRLAPPAGIHRGRSFEQRLAGYPDSAAWLMIVLGFGALGAITRRAPRDPFEEQQIL